MASPFSTGSPVSTGRIITAADSGSAGGNRYVAPPVAPPPDVSLFTTGSVFAAPPAGIQQVDLQLGSHPQVTGLAFAASPVTVNEGAFLFRQCSRKRDKSKDKKKKGKAPEAPERDRWLPGKVVRIQGEGRQTKVYLIMLTTAEAASFGFFFQKGDDELWPKKCCGVFLHNTKTPSWWLAQQGGNFGVMTAKAGRSLDAEETEVEETGDEADGGEGDKANADKGKGKADEAGQAQANEAGKAKIKQENKEKVVDLTSSPASPQRMSATFHGDGDDLTQMRAAVSATWLSDGDDLSQMRAEVAKLKNSLALAKQAAASQKQAQANEAGKAKIKQEKQDDQKRKHEDVQTGAASAPDSKMAKFATASIAGIRTARAGVALGLEGGTRAVRGIASACVWTSELFQQAKAYVQPPQPEPPHHPDDLAEAGNGSLPAADAPTAWGPGQAVPFVTGPPAPDAAKAAKLPSTEPATQNSSGAGWGT